MERQFSTKTKLLDSVRKLFTSPMLERAMLSAVGGSQYGGTLSKVIPGPHLYRHGSKRRVTRDGIEFELDPSCLMQWYVYWNLKEKQRDRLYSLVKPGDIVLDVGTNIGETLLHFAKIVGDSGYVYGFEPDGDNFRNVIRNIELNNAGNVHVFDLGVSDKTDKQRLYRVDPNNLGMNRILTDEEAAAFDDFVDIEVDTLDNIISAEKIDRIDFIKIDIEGYEMHALRGARSLLESFLPKLFIEVGYNRLIKNGTSPTELVHFLNDLGYSIFHAETDQMITPEYDFSPLGDGGIDIYAFCGEREENV